MNTRRHMLRWMALGAGSLAGLVPALRRKPAAQVLSQQTAPKLEFEKIAKISDLKEGPFLVKEGFKGKPVLVLEAPTTETETPKPTGTAETSSSYRAVDPTCLHRDCLVDWDSAKAQFVCPCHGSKFDLDGKVIKGPSKEDLPAIYTVKVEGEDILIALS